MFTANSRKQKVSLFFKPKRPLLCHSNLRLPTRLRNQNSVKSFHADKERPKPLPLSWEFLQKRQKIDFLIEILVIYY
jgi:hypothetical protein